MTPKYLFFHFFLRHKILLVILTFLFFIILYFSQKNQLDLNGQLEPIDVVYTWVNGSDPRFLANLKDCLKLYRDDVTDSSPQRFDDKYELKFSLRSLEQYAPWVRNVYIVTNGQIPYWLNMDHERINIITHDQIFPDSNDIPTFNSIAIEMHLHRIPGISKHFIYLNDDIFFGAPVYRDDFLRMSGSFVVYLSWVIPPCALDCPWLYVNDGQCDAQCYNEACQNDGHDCDDEEKNAMGELVQHYQNNQVESEQPLEPPHPKEQSHLQISSQNAANLSQIVSKHNEDVMLRNKRRRRKTLRVTNSSLIDKIQGIRKPMGGDTYLESLQHTNRMLNKRYGFRTRYVAAHGPVMINVDIMASMQDAFKSECLMASKNKLRKSTDVQFSTAYYYYLMQETDVVEVEDIFDMFDTDKSGTWSDREIRTLLTQLYELPLSFAIADHFELILANCSTLGNYAEVATPEYERYIDSKLPTISKEMITKCSALCDMLTVQFGRKLRYKYIMMENKEEHVTFKMLKTNLSDVVGHLDEIRRKPSKFVCLNDNLRPGLQEDNELVKSVLYDFYVSLFPTVSKFELAPEFRNRFLYMDELNTWKTYHFQLKIFMFAVLATLCYICAVRLCDRSNQSRKYF